jgi:integration host factor subunit alpha
MSKPLTKTGIIRAIQKENGYSKQKSADIVESLLEIIKRTLESGEDVLVSGFGKFHVRSKRARKGRNPATGDHLTLPARKVVRFRCSERLRDQINEE